ncbi:MAG: hypothetical protein OHK0023_21090 [Anaerolineae bacterium]
MTNTAYTQSATYRRCQALFDAQYPNFQNAGQIYAQWASERIEGTTTVLDVGCGRDSLAAEAIRKARRSLGVDLVPSDLIHNQLVHWPALANAYALPFPTAHVDVITSQWVVEHFPDPQRAFAEMRRVLRPDGSIILLTTNAANYVPRLSRLVPDSVRDFALHRLLRRPRHESHPTFYRANTRRALEQTANAAGLVVKRITFVGNPFYFAFSLPLFRVALWWERVTDTPRRQHLKLYLIAELAAAV